MLTYPKLVNRTLLLLLLYSLLLFTLLTLAHNIHYQWQAFLRQRRLQLRLKPDYFHLFTPQRNIPFRLKSPSQHWLSGNLRWRPHRTIDLQLAWPKIHWCLQPKLNIDSSPGQLNIQLKHDGKLAIHLRADSLHINEQRLSHWTLTLLAQPLHLPSTIDLARLLRASQLSFEQTLLEIIQDGPQLQLLSQAEQQQQRAVTLNSQLHLPNIDHDFLNQPINRTWLLTTLVTGSRGRLLLQATTQLVKNGLDKTTIKRWLQYDGQFYRLNATFYAAQLTVNQQPSRSLWAILFS